jgi:hypothetical protein
MTDKRIKVLGLLLLFTMGMACAFRLLSPSPHHTIQTDKQSFASGYHQELHSEIKPAAVLRQIESFIRSGDEILNSTTNEEEILSELRDWARKDPETALIWGQQQTNSSERTEVLTDACFQIAQADPERAVILAEQLNLSKDVVLENLAQQWAAKDLTMAYNWIMAQPAGDQRDALATGIAFVWSQTEPVNAALFVAQQIPPGPVQDEAAIMVLHQWALVDSTGASAWAQQFPENPLRNRALNELSGMAQYKQAIAQSK